MIDTHFLPKDLNLMVSSFVLIGISIFFFVNQRFKNAILFLTLGGFVLFFSMAWIDPLIWDWDEKYHAVVAQHLLAHPFKPTLVENPVFAYDYKSWYWNNIWLHKPPLTLWEIMLCYKMFGITELAVRIPAVVESTILILIIYDLGKSVLNKETGYLAAFLWTLNYFVVSISTGYFGMGGVDITFTFYIILSFWTWIKYSITGKNYFFILIGVFSGLAVLTKFLVGLLIFAAWFVTIIFDPQKRFEIKSYLKLLISFCISVVIFLPWQIYIFHAFPIEASYELNFNSRHLTEVIEGHKGDMWYYLDMLKKTIGRWAVFLVIPALYIFYKRIENKSHRDFIFSAIIIAYTFFSYAATKLECFAFIVQPLLFLGFGSLIFIFFEWLQFRINVKLFKVIQYLLLILIGAISVNINEIEALHTEVLVENVYRHNKVRFTKYYKRLPELLEGRKILFGNPCPDCAVEMMFYAPFTSVFNNYPDSLQYEKLKLGHEKIAAFDSDQMPKFMKNDTSLKIIEFKIPD